MEQYAMTNDAAYAASKAGYGTPAARASQNLAKPAIQAEITAARHRLHTEGFAIGVGVLIDLATSDKTPANVRRSAASDLVKYGKDEADSASKDPHEMTGNELQEAIAKLTREASERSRPVLQLEANRSTIDEAEPDILG